MALVIGRNKELLEWLASLGLPTKNVAEVDIRIRPDEIVTARVLINVDIDLNNNTRSKYRVFEFHEVTNGRT